MFFDLHSDLLTADKPESFVFESVKRAREKNACVNYAVFKGDGDLNFLKEKLKLKRRAGVKYYSLEDCCYVSESSVYEDIDLLFEILNVEKPLCVSLCWNNENAFASGCSAEGGLKPAGKYFIKRLNEAKIPLDLSHINEWGFYEALDLSFKPLCTHSALGFIYPHRRNLKKEQIEKLLRRGGIFGVIGVKHFLFNYAQTLKENSSSVLGESAFYAHIDGYLQNFGVNGLCVGTDFFGSDAPVFSDGDYSFCTELENRLALMPVLSQQDIINILYGHARAFFNI